MEMTLSEAISKRIRELCQEQGIAVDVLIKRTNASPTAVAMVIKGSDELVMLDVMKSICDALGITMEKFFNCDLFSHF